MNYNGDNYENVRPNFAISAYIIYLNTIEHLEPTVNIILREIIPTNHNIRAKFQENIGNLRLTYKGPIHTPDDPTSNPKNFRPIISVNHEVKLIETRLHKFYYYVSHINKDYQLSDRINIAMDKVNKYINAINDTDTGALVFIDIENAYGSVNYKLMSQMLDKSELGEYYRAFYKNPLVQDNKGTMFRYDNGLFQGSPLSQLYFMIYLDYVLHDIKPYVDDIIAYMDDIVLYFKSDDETLPIIEKIFNSYGLKFNIRKVRSYGCSKIRSATANFKYLGNKIFDIHQTFIKTRTEIKEMHGIQYCKFVLSAKSTHYYKFLNATYPEYIEELIRIGETKVEIKNYAQMHRDHINFGYRGLLCELRRYINK